MNKLYSVIKETFGLVFMSQVIISRVSSIYYETRGSQDRPLWYTYVGRMTRTKGCTRRQSFMIQRVIYDQTNCSRLFPMRTVVS